MKTVIVGMSGGVDSSVTALLLKRQGYKVIGLFMKNWNEEDEFCSVREDYEDVIQICHQLEIPYYSVNFSKEYWDHVFSCCLKQYEAGFTPNPDILCNREIKFNVFLKKALELGGNYLATGHYARNLFDGKWRLGRGIDTEKDQSYFLYTLKSSILERVLFPLGELTKNEVRQIAEEAGLATAKKKDSTGICFIGKRPFKDFLSNYLPVKPGNFEKLSGEVVGKHDGIAYYTIGQRKGLKIGGEGEAWYVVGKDASRNVVYVEQGDDHPALFQKALTVTDISWVDDELPNLPYSCTAKIRYRSLDAKCTMISREGKLIVEFDELQKAVTPYQSIVFYQDEICLGGGLIEPANLFHGTCR